MQSDVDIMKSVQAGETSRFAELVNRYRPRLLRFAVSKLRDHALAEDLVQDAFLAAFHARQSYSAEFAFSTWIWTIVLNLTRRAQSKVQQSKIRQKQLTKLAVTSRTSDPPIAPLLEEEQSEKIDAWLAQLPDVNSDAIRLRFFGNLPYAEIALAMECSESGAKRRVKTGLIMLSRLADNEM